MPTPLLIAQVTVANPLDGPAPTLHLPDPAHAPPAVTGLLDQARDALLGVLVDNLPFILAGIVLAAAIFVALRLLTVSKFGRGVGVDDGGQTHWKF